ncbi:MAG: hypothetical protein ABI186_07965 [Candidatus Elarobacter sp.]
MRLVMDAGVAYQKQIGLGFETSGDGDTLFVETQIGMPGGSCNPNTLKKTYLRAPHFRSLLDLYPVLAHVAFSGTILTRWGDSGGGQPQDEGDRLLRLIDAKHVYDPRPCTVVATRRERVRVRTGTYAATRVSASFAPGPRESLQRIDLWSSPVVPFGVVRYRATLRELPPFEFVLDSFGHGYKSDLAMTLQTIRAMTPGGSAMYSG